MKSKKYDIKQVGTVLKQIKPEMELMVKTLGEGSDFINYVRSKLQECIAADDLIKALAIIDYTIHNTDLYGKDLVLVKDTEDTLAITTIAYEADHNEFASNLAGLCSALHFIDDI